MFDSQEYSHKNDICINHTIKAHGKQPCYSKAVAQKYFNKKLCSDC